MKILFVHPSALLYSELFLRLEPLGLERVAAAARAAGHEVRIIDLQIFRQAELERELVEFRPDAVGFGLNYLANVPEVIELAHCVKHLLPSCYVFVGGHSISFLAGHLLQQADGAVDAVVRGEGETAVAPLLEAFRPGGDQPQAPGGRRRGADDGDRRSASAARPDELCQDAVEVSARV